MQVLSWHNAWQVGQNSPYACLRQTSKFHHQVSFSKYKVAKFCINEFPGQHSWKEYPRIKSANAKNFAFKRGLVVKFARLTQSRIRAIVFLPEFVENYESRGESSSFLLPTSDFQIPTSNFQLLAHIPIYCGFCFGSAGFALWFKSIFFKAF